MNMPIVIVGGGPAGLSCARSYRELGGRERVVILGDDPDPPYVRPALSKEFLRGEVERDALPIEDAGFYERRRVELRTGVRVASIDPERRVVVTEHGETIGYASCVLACGSRPARPPVPGIDHPRVLTLRRIADSERLRDEVTEGDRVLVVGSGFIGCEAAISIAVRGAAVTVATMEGRPQEARLGTEVGGRIEGWLGEAGIELITEAELESIDDVDGDGLAVNLSGRALEADTVLAALGVDRNIELAEAAGIELTAGLIPTDERMRTAVDGILAVGDVALAHNGAAERRLAVEHWGEALRHGEIAGAVLAGEQDETWANAPGFWSGLGPRTIKQVAWGDGFDRVEVTDHGDEAFTARYVLNDELVGVLTHDADGDYENGRRQVEARTSWR